MTPDDSIKMRRAKKVVDNGTGPFAVPLAQLTESIITNDKLDQLTEAIKSIELPEYPEIEIPESKEVVFPEIQKVEITNLPETPDISKQLALLKEIASELKKKEQYTYDIEVDSNLKEQLRGERGPRGENGSPDTAQEIADKLNTLEEKVDLSVLKGWKEFIANLGEKTSSTKVYGSRLLRNLADVIGVKEATTGQVLSKRADGTFGFSTISGGSGSNSFETVSKNLSSVGATFNYTGSQLTSIVYTSGITKTLNYTGSQLTSIVLSGSTPSGIDLTKTLSYTGSQLTGVAYS